jgi:Ca2+-binding EF-hand superfamily protein
MLNKLFELLDNDNDGSISSWKMSLDAVPIQKQRLLKPLIDEMKAGSHTLSKEEFIEACNLLLGTLNIHEKHLLLS